MRAEFFCPKCRTRTKTLIKEGGMLACYRCGFAVGVEILEIKTICITKAHIEKLPFDLRKRVYDLIRRGRLIFVKKFDLCTGRDLLCLEPKSIRDEEALEVLRQIEALLKI